MIKFHTGFLLLFQLRRFRELDFLAHSQTRSFEQPVLLVQFHRKLPLDFSYLQDSEHRFLLAQSHKLDLRLLYFLIGNQNIHFLIHIHTLLKVSLKQSGIESFF